MLHSCNWTEVQSPTTLSTRLEILSCRIHLRVFCSKFGESKGGVQTSTDLHPKRAFGTVIPAIRNDKSPALARSIIFWRLLCRDQAQGKNIMGCTHSIFPRLIHPHLGKELYITLVNCYRGGTRRGDKQPKKEGGSNQILGKAPTLHVMID